jgi:NAD(P)-dependent dehydrogenase (short-subunit alcohol dehydrogenase family)
MDTGVAHGRSLQEELSGKHVLITGASSGIGWAAALKVAAAGGVPLLVARNVEKLEELRAEIVAGAGDGDLAVCQAGLHRPPDALE